MSTFTPIPTEPQPSIVTPKNGLGIAGLVLGIVAVLFGLIPLTFFIAAVLGVIGLVLGLVGFSRARKGMATNKKTALSGVIASIVALALSIFGGVTVINAVDELATDLDAIGQDVETVTPEGTGEAQADEPADDTGSSAAAFGETVTFEDGVAVSVSAPSPYTPTEYAIAGDFPAYVQFTVTITNGSTENYDPTVLFSAMSGGVEGEEVYDENVGSSPSTTLLPGKSATYTMAFGVNDPSDIVLEGMLGWDYDNVIFTS